ncbi:MAG TPA: 3-carboxy-cis,cis-muconate cycloisomerase [Candidatus Acidoferrum sp.]|nr:3-carboxy-cis,cis-muconate cycloisomerase [Candidatus Acidoferrum sp.]
MNLLDGLFRSEEVEKWLSDRTCLQAMLSFESALAKAESHAGVIPKSAVQAISQQCKAPLFDLDALSRAAKSSGNTAIPVVKALTALVAKNNAEAAGYVHWGATSQDVIDTGLILQLCGALTCIAADIDKLAHALAELATEHRSTVMVGRTWMQHASPTTFGAKVAGWLDAIDRHRARLRETQARCLVLQFGGAVGTHAALEGKGDEVAKNLAQELKLPLAEIPWHSHRDRVAEIATTLGLLVGTLGKIASDISLLSQTEVAEVFEPTEKGRGGSSTMPHKRNPVACAAVLSAATRVPGLVGTMLAAMPQEHERGLGGWHAEWETLPEIVSLVGGAAHTVAALAPRLDVDAERMRQNLDETHGLIFAEAVSMALAKKIGKAKAHDVVEAACNTSRKDGRHLRDVVDDEPSINKHFSMEEIDALFDAQNYLGLAEEFVDRVVEASKKSATES